MRRFIAASTFAGALVTSISAQVTQRINVTWHGAPTQDGASNVAPSISADGRYVAFRSDDPDLVPGVANNHAHVYVRDRWLGTTERVSVDSAGAQGDNESDFPAISADGRTVAFTSNATNLVPGDSNGYQDVFVHDRRTGRTGRVSVAHDGTQGDGPSAEPDTPPALSADGRFVAFVSRAENLVPGDSNGFADVFVRDRTLGTIDRVSLDSNGAQGNAHSGTHRTLSISADGRFVAFESEATNLVPGDTNGRWDVFVRDWQFGTTERVSVGNGAEPGAAQGNQHSFSSSMSADGRFVAFCTESSNLVPEDSDAQADVLVRDRWNATTELVSLDLPGSGFLDSFRPAISADGRWVAFEHSDEIYLRDRGTATTELVTVPLGGKSPIHDSHRPAVSADARFVTYDSWLSNLVPDDTVFSLDVFLRDRAHESSTSLCAPGAASVVDCPCGNPPSGPTRGCDNSAATGGASLSIFGGQFVSSDSLVLATRHAMPNATSIVLQGTAPIESGVAFGQGVLCVGGATTRLYTKAAVAGSTEVPDFAAGEPTVHARSAQLGDPISPGTTRWYAVVYRDPIPLGGCRSTFNTTPTREVVWLP